MIIHAKSKRFKIKQQMLLVGVLFSIVVGIAIIGLFEISKVSNLQRVERNNLTFLNSLELRIIELDELKTATNRAQKVAQMLTIRAKDPKAMGVIQILEEMESLVSKIFEYTSFIERFFFKLIGFGHVFNNARAGWDLLKSTQKAVTEYQLLGSSYDILFERIKYFGEEVRHLDNQFSIIANSTANFVSKSMISIVILGFIVALIFSFLILRNVLQQLRMANTDIRTSSQELYATSDQQSGTVSQQASAMSEINSVMQELVATSKQVSEISSQMASLAEQSNKAVKKGHESLQYAMNGIKIIEKKNAVTSANMLNLGEKAQQIGVVLEVINELSQQVTVLSYNATIEAAGAGESGKRFMAVADRIIKLAERSARSGKEIKGIIEDIQADSNKTIMSVEDAEKSVADGVSAVTEVQEALENVSKFVQLMWDAVQEIDISSKQQTTGIEQAATSVEDITILSSENDESAKQVLQTANQLLEMAESVEQM